ncbi:hypothetical protein TWF694_003697 [Orbilia ellipsospora]|uniref:F-box domain-containing protein n=1 Tax=Orbilia ellipsospora TaxID=2528407 RepID=A0AAV9WYX4_9PEZI
MATTLASLPIEIHEEILFYLSFEERMQVVTAFILWEDILNKPRASSRIDRYTPDQNYGTWYPNIEVHKFMGETAGLSCISLRDSIQTYSFNIYQDSFNAHISTDPPILLSSTDVTNSIFLDDPIVFDSPGRSATGDDVLGATISLDKYGKKWHSDFDLHLSRGSTIRQLFQRIAVVVSQSDMVPLGQLLKYATRRWVYKSILMDDCGPYNITIRPRVYFHGNKWKKTLDIHARTP